MVECQTRGVCPSYVKVETVAQNSSSGRVLGGITTSNHATLRRTITTSICVGCSELYVKVASDPAKRECSWSEDALTGLERKMLVFNYS